MQDTHSRFSAPAHHGVPFNKKAIREKQSLWFQLPLLQRILISNLLIISCSAIIGSWFTAQLAEAGSFNVVTFVIIICCATLLSGSISFFTLKSAFRPFHELQRVLTKIHAGYPRAHVALSRINDPDVREFTGALRQMLVRLEDNARVIQEDQHQLQIMTARVITAQENERKRIARELHDEASQSLTAIIMGLDAARRQARDEQQETRLGSLRDMATATLDELRKLALDLRPTMLDDLGLVPAVRWLSRGAGERANFEVKLELDRIGDTDRLPPELETCLFRITQESLTNIIKHAQATRVDIRMSRLLNDNIKLEIRDNGKGFNMSEARHKAICGGHLGLFDIEERAGLLGGKASIMSGDSGTTIQIVVPLKPHGCPF
ncbi:MAG: sensor histidine kinase [Chloroflexi bacterium]|uniref:Sensor histidine kinase n=1 Tax=Candidatus Chlorohelix allophototropha TaxID=3003348 RepID=A0A8T7M760_9CHLR|nr:sensor histidine kinase [Chloroflexota bacterium]WJW69757.1 sensor histidine kinase [Chloroflexota bacterium L227-S17]